MPDCRHSLTRAAGPNRRSAARRAALLCVLLSSPAQGQEPTNGEIEYRNSCIACHGPKGEGNGPLVDELMKRPADLTILAQKNGGLFPYNRVYAVIDGRSLIPRHGDREMPIWGTQFLEENVEKYGPDAGEIVTQERIHELANYLESLQK